MVDLVKNKLKEIIVVCKQHEVETLSLFGSAANDTMHAESDIDFLVQFSDQIDLLDYADNYFALLHKLEELLNMKVDLVSVRSLKNPVLREHIYQSKVDVYAA